MAGPASRTIHPSTTPGRLGGSGTAEALAAGCGTADHHSAENNLLRRRAQGVRLPHGAAAPGAFSRTPWRTFKSGCGVVIGGGLTASTRDRAEGLLPRAKSEEKLLDRHEVLCQSAGEEMVFSLPRPRAHVYAELLEAAVPASRARARQRCRRGARLDPPGRPVGRRDHRLPQDSSTPARLTAQPRGVAKVLSRKASSRSRGSRRSSGARSARASRRCASPCRSRSGKWQDAAEMVELPARNVCVAAARAPTSRWRRSRPAPSARSEARQLPAVPPGEGSSSRPRSPTILRRRGFFTQLLEGRAAGQSSSRSSTDLRGSAVKAMGLGKTVTPSSPGCSPRSVPDHARSAPAPTTPGGAGELARSHARLDDDWRDRARGPPPHADDPRGGGAG